MCDSGRGNDRGGGEAGAGEQRPGLSHAPQEQYRGHHHQVGLSGGRYYMWTLRDISRCLDLLGGRDYIHSYMCIGLTGDTGLTLELLM